jgi:hypothetical protein
MRWWPLLVLVAGCLDKVPADDRDSDRIPDAVDNCPDVANPDQDDSNELTPAADGVGTACDDNGGLDRQLFDGFAQPNQLWLVIGQGWQITNDRAQVQLSAAGAIRYAGTARGTFSLAAHATLPMSGSVGIQARDGGPPDTVMTVCRARSSRPARPCCT